MVCGSKHAYAVTQAREDRAVSSKTLQFRGSVVTSDAGLLAYRELDDALGLTVMAGEMLADARTGKTGRHALVGLLLRWLRRLRWYRNVVSIVLKVLQQSSRKVCCAQGFVGEVRGNEAQQPICESKEFLGCLI